MTMPCPEPLELTRLLDGELTENRAALLRAHAAGAMAAVMGRLDDADAQAATEAARAPRRWGGARAWAGVAAAAAVVLVATATLRGEPAGAFAARGAAVAWPSKVGVELWSLQGQPRRLSPGDPLAPGVPVVASYSNVDPAPAFLLAFALDPEGEVHWLYPGYADARQDPASLRLEGSVVQRALAESVVLQEVPAGPLRLITVVSRTPLHVSAIEGASPAERDPAALRRRWPEARIDELPLRYAPHLAVP